ncbi:hypothetical protein FOA52_013110 [Chlamydomonas sp. UWO 241]|nr:hypothetical protein FOA52_013110 [Chlamydomonas sp. UWO 241]
MTAAPKQGPFLPFLPQDNSSLPDAEEAVGAVGADLASLLRQPASSFWRTVGGEPSLATCLDSYLRFKRRVHDSPTGAPVSDESPAAVALSRRVLMVLLRLVSTKEGAPPAAERAQLLASRSLIDVPKLMDAAVLYGPANPDLTRRLLSQAFALLPKLETETANTAPLLSNNLVQLAERGAVMAAAVTQRGDAAAASGMLDTLAYVRDTALTLAATAACHPPAGAALLSAQHGPALIGALSKVHDVLLPQPSPDRRVVENARRSADADMAAALRQPVVASACGVSPAAAAASVASLRTRLQQLAALLLRCAFLRGPSGGLSTSHGGEGGGVGSTGGGGGVSADQRGADLLTIVLSVCGDRDTTAPVRDQLLVAANDSFGLGTDVAAAMQEGWLAMDDAQFDYLLALIGADRGRIYGELERRAGGGGGASGAGAAGPSGSNCGGAESAAALAPLLAQIREMLPGYGDGFLAACLHHYAMAPERVLNHLLEGSLHPDLQALDPQLARWSPPGAPSTNANGPPQGGLPGSWGAAAADATAAVAAAAAKRSVAVPGFGILGGGGGVEGGGGGAMHRGVARLFGRVEPDVREATRLAAVAMQWESDEEKAGGYDDEYDDSFDGLGGAGNKADGVADVEGEDTAADARSRFAGGANSAMAGGGAASSYGSGASTSGGRAGGGNGGGGGGGGGANAFSGGGGNGGGGKKAEKLWVLDGKVYNYAKAGAQQVVSRDAATAATAAAQLATEAIMGLGPGGNRGAYAQQLAQLESRAAGGSRGGGGGGNGRGGGGGRGGGAQGGGGEDGDGDGDGGGGRGEGRGRGSYGHKEQNKAAIGNHHRKDRSMRKMGL